MRIQATVTLKALRNALGVASIPGATTIERRVGDDVEQIVRLPKAEVDDDDAWEMLRAEGYGSSWEDDERIEPPSERDLADWIGTLLAGDVAMARLLAPRVFADQATLEACERALTPALGLRRAA